MKGAALIEQIARVGRWQRFGIFIGTIVVMGAVFFYLVYMPLAGNISNLEEEIERLTGQIAQSRIKARNLALLEEEWRNVDARFQEALRILPDSREIPTLLRSITRKGEESRLEFLLFNPQKEIEGDFFVEIPVAIEVKGPYHDVVHFLSRLSSMERIVNVLNVSMRPEKPLSSVLITRCTAVTYRFKGEVSEGERPKDRP